MASAIADRLRRYFATDSHGALAVYLYGSEARGTAGPNSDVDLALLFGRRPEATLAAQPYGLEDDLSGILGRPAQIVVLDTAPPELVHHVLRDGLLLLDRDRATRIRFEVEARNAYFDVKPVLDRYRRLAG